VSLYDSMTTNSSDVSQGLKIPGDDASPFERISRRSAVDEVRSQLISLIESDQLKVNALLPSEAELGQHFGVSRPVVREALGSLQTLGYTESQPGRGTRVTSKVVKVSLSFGQYSSTDLNEIRRFVEVPAAARAAQVRTPDQVKALAETLDEHDRATTAVEAVRLDGQFHIGIAKATGNLLVVRLIEDLRETMQAQSLALSEVPQRSASAAREHRAVLDCIRHQDEAGAAAAMVDHLSGVETALEALARRRSGNA
jgi:DNA-binding FadR family transcriptional regulator